MEETVEANNQAFLKTRLLMEDQSPRTRAASGWTKPLGRGKKFCHSVFSGDEFVAQPHSVAVITPVNHHCVGGLEIDDDFPVVGTDSQPTRGLYAAGEVAGKTIPGKKVDHNVISGADFALQVHRNIRLVTTSLLDCVVIDRVTGVACNKYMLGGKEKRTSLALLSGGGLS